MPREAKLKTACSSVASNMSEKQDANLCCMTAHIQPSSPLILTSTLLGIRVHMEYKDQPKNKGTAEDNSAKKNTLEKASSPSFAKSPASSTENKQLDQLLQNNGGKSQVEISVTKAPELLVSTGTDWVAVLGFAITALIVLLTTRQTIKNSERLIKSQEDVAKESARENREVVRCELTANNRQAWINTLRADLAAYIAAISAIWDLHQIKAGRAQVLREHGSVEGNLKELFEWSLAYHEKIQESERLLAKIKLLINPGEDKSQILMKALEKAFDDVKSNRLPTKACNEVISASQPILKEEWERVKSMT